MKSIEKLVFLCFPLQLALATNSHDSKTINSSRPAPTPVVRGAPFKRSQHCLKLRTLRRASFCCVKPVAPAQKGPFKERLASVSSPPP